MGLLYMKADYKELKKKLGSTYTTTTTEVGIVGSIEDWLRQHGIEPNEAKMKIIYTIFDNKTPYPHQEIDRLFIVNYLNNNKYKTLSKTKGLI